MIINAARVPTIYSNNNKFILTPISDLLLFDLKEASSRELAMVCSCFPWLETPSLAVVSQK